MKFLNSVTIPGRASIFYLLLGRISIFTYRFSIIIIILYDQHILLFHNGFKTKVGETRIERMHQYEKRKRKTSKTFNTL